MDAFRAIDALLATAVPLPPPGERARMRSVFDFDVEKVARVLNTDAATLTAWENGAAEPEGLARALYAYFLTQAQARAGIRTEPGAERTTPDSAVEALPQPAPCVLCGNPASRQVDGYPQHLTATDCTAAAPTLPSASALRPAQHEAAVGRRIPAPRSGGTRHLGGRHGLIGEMVDAALAAHGGDLAEAAAALVAGAAPDAMRLFSACRESGQYDIVRYPALPDMLRTPSPGTPDLIWEGRLNWQCPHALEVPGAVAALNISGARLSALKTHLPVGQLQPTAPEPHEPRRAGIHLVTPPAWEHDAYLPNPLGARHESGPVWITEPTLRLLLRLSKSKDALCGPPDIHESYTAGSTENLLEKFRTTLRDARARALDEDDSVTLEYVKAMHTGFVLAVGESAHSRQLCRPDWTHIIHSQAYATLWMKAYKAYKAGMTLARVCGTDELHLQGDWRHVFEEGTDLGKVTLNSTYQPHAISAASEQGKHVLCIDPCVEKRRYEYAGGRYVGCRTCGGDLCTGCMTVHLAPSDVPYELNDDNLCPGCQQAK